MPTTTTTIAAAAAAASGWQPSDVIALLLGLGGLLVAMVVPALTFRNERRHREDDREEAHRREAAAILGPAFALILEYRETVYLDVKSEGDVSALFERLRELDRRMDRDVRPSLMAMVSTSPPGHAVAAGRLMRALAALPLAATRSGRVACRVRATHPRARSCAWSSTRLTTRRSLRSTSGAASSRPKGFRLVDAGSESLPLSSPVSGLRRTRRGRNVDHAVTAEALSPRRRGLKD